MRTLNKGSFLLAALLLSTAGAQTVNLRVLGTSDLHMAALGYDYYQDKPTGEYGLENVAALAQQARREADNSILLDNGDTLQGNPLGDYLARVQPVAAGQRHPMLHAMSRLGYTAMGLGNHEFNYGLDFLDRSVATAPFAVLNANIVRPDGSYRFQPYQLKDLIVTDTDGKLHTLRIGITSFAPPQVMQWDKAHLEGRVQALDIVEAARRVVPQMQAQGADVIVVLAHTGIGRGEYQPMDEAAATELTRVPGIDAVLTGHSHAQFPSEAYRDVPGADLARGTINGVPVVMPGAWGSHLGVMDLRLSYDAASDDWQVAEGTGTLRSVWDKVNKQALVKPDPAVAAAIAPAHQGTLDYVRSRVAELKAPITSYWALVQDDPSVQLVNDAQRAYVKRALAGTEYAELPVLGAAAPFKAGGRMGPEYYTDIPAGDLAIRNVADLYVYPNTVQAVVVTGAQLREWLERSAGVFRRIDPASREVQPLVDSAFPTYNYDVIDGVTYQIDVTQPSRYGQDGELVNPGTHRIVNLQYQGQPVDPQARFVVATNNYRASGGGKFPGLDGSNIVLAAPDETRQALISYFTEQGTVDPTADGNWSLLPVPGVQLEVLTAPAASRTAPANVSPQGTAEGGFARYLLRLN
ncbi:2',3'-cyclic-nucleotide 2'-phosphodiesterase [Deinococcus piscis]|uniref:2',3'-cyclic-nucleotide 2'-phosphodiesterase n=1 Tax=Deinococcus piscis TaxID=394230 RepID=A0ABQ3K4F4_9DEIO|nr:bifunctional 2',3'-cyclic-nucleotide 2'-phosphodiesterase/3'-nucleotidase [Deinococcus piscis]GHG02709.1 2',3'-cyclic-nucleotide 2'-phosphodiesterase [Deinococcus piscis]